MPSRRAPQAAVLVLVTIVRAAAAWDPSGLLAPVGGQGQPLLGSGGVYRWAPLVLGLPILLAGTACTVGALARQSVPRRWMLPSFG